MKITPKNWSEFQHYKDRKPSWIKLHRELLDNYEFSCLPVASRALAPCLWLLASEYEGGAIEASIEALAFRLRMTTKELHLALTPLIDAGFFIASNPLADCKQDAIPERETQVTRKIEKRVAAYAAEFEEFWKSKPARKGENPKHPASLSYLNAVKSGADPAKINAAAKRWSRDASEIPDRDRQFIPRAVTWLNQRRFDDYQVTGDEEKYKIDYALMRSNGFEQRDGKWVKIEEVSNDG